MKTTIIKLSKKEIQQLLKKENLLSFNRKITKSHSMSILESINTYGMLRLPVIVNLIYDNNRKSIADGQHTLTGLVTSMSKNQHQECIEVDCENKKQVIDLIAKLNTTAKSWTNENFLNAWLNFGKEYKYYTDYFYLNNMQKESTISLSKILDIFVSNIESFKKGEPKMKNRLEAECVYRFAKHFRIEYKSAAHQIAGVIKFAQTRKWNDEIYVDNFISRVDRYGEKCNYPKDREDVKNLLQKLYDKTDVEFDNYIKNCND